MSEADAFIRECAPWADSHRRFLSDLLAIPPLFQEPLSNHTTMRVGGPAEALVTVADIMELRTLMEYIETRRLRHFVLGKGGNTLFTSRGFCGIVIRLGRTFDACDIHENKVSAGGALSLPSLARQTAAQGLTGLEFACGIPGLVGGSLVGNAGTGSESLSDHLVFIDLLDRKNEIRRLTREEVGFSYRHSNLTAVSSVVLRAHFRLRQSHPQATRQRISSLTEYRGETQPLKFPSAGCIFKNPVPRKNGDSPRSAGALIEGAGMKGVTVGGAEVSRIHANFIVTRGHATSDDVQELIRQVHARVRERFGVSLELEVRIVEA